MDEVWQTADPKWVVHIATRQGVMDNDAKTRFAIWCAQQVRHLLPPLGLVALDMLERRLHTGPDGFRSVVYLDICRAACESTEQEDQVHAVDCVYHAHVGFPSDSMQKALGASAAKAALQSPKKHRKERAALARVMAEDSAEEAQAAWLRANVAPIFK